MKSFSKPVLLACGLPVILAAFPSCTRAKYTPPHSQAAQGASAQSADVSPLNGYWLEQSVPVGQVSNYGGHASKPSSIYIQDGKISNVVKYSDSSTDTFTTGIAANASNFENGAWVIHGNDYVVTIVNHGNTLDISDVLNYKGSSTTLRMLYTKTDASTAAQHARSLWFQKTPQYKFATQYCEQVNQPDPNAAAMVNQINQFVNKDLARQQMTVSKIQALRNATGKTVTSCQIAEDYLERGIEFAKTGVTPTYPDLAKRPTLKVSVDAKTNLAPLLALELDDLSMQSDDQEASTVDLSQLAAIVGLESLTLQGLHVSQLDKLASLSNLKDLTLIAMDLPDYTVLKKLPSLVGLHLQGSFSVARALPVISGLTQLDTLSLDNTGAVSAQKTDLSPLTSLPNLINLSVYGDFFNNLNFLPHLENLTTLGVTLENDDSVDMIGSLAKITNLKNVTIQKSVKTADDLKFVAKIPNLVGLQLSLAAGFSDLSMINEKNCSSLESITLTDASKQFAPLPDLRNAMAIPGLSSVAASQFTISDLSVFEALLKADSSNNVCLNTDKTTTSQKTEDQNLRTKFGSQYRSKMSFN